MSAFRGYFALNGREIANSSRVVAHLGSDVPLRDVDAFGIASTENLPYTLPFALDTYNDTLPYTLPFVLGDPLGPCDLIPATGHSGLYEISNTSVEMRPGLWSPPVGAKQYGPSLFTIDGCWGSASLCSTCSGAVGYDDSWPGLRDFLAVDAVYRPELAPWCASELPESLEFGGVWVMDVKGLDTMPIERTVTQAVGDGGVTISARNPSRTVTFEAMLIACSHAGLKFGLDWLTELLRMTDTDPDSTLRYLAASPTHSAVDPASLVREIHNVVLTRAPEVIDAKNTLGGANRHANLYRVSWDLTALSPFAWLPEVNIPVQWDQITRQPINWVHAADCELPETCADMPVMFSTECTPEEIAVLTTPPPVCGGCLPVGGIDKYLFRVPTQDYAFRSRQTAVSMVVKNLDTNPITLQGFWRICGTDVRCEDNRFPVQISGLPGGAELHLDGVTGRTWAYYDSRIRQPVGVVGTPNGAPWRPPLIDRQTCWDFIIQAPTTAQFTCELTLIDRET